ncbi:phage tail tape measure protein [Mycobacterium sherrisii]|uniref:phage tail tape measure protein n=1 Tax=Mycobacterium sherrisii TaxID=243061 RepID=UPI0039767EF2
MPVYLDVESRLERGALEATAREISAVFNRVGADISRGLGGSLSRALGALDTSAARAELGGLERAWTRAADVEAEAARRMVSSARAVEVAQARAAEAADRFGDSSAKALAAQAALADKQAIAARDQRAYADALVANEAAHRSHTRALEDSAAAASMAGRAFNAAGIGSVAVFTGSVLEATKAAGDFQASQQRLVSSAGEHAQNLKAVSDGILNLTGQVAYSSQELSQGMYTVEKAGYRGADGINVLSAAAQLAKAENADLGEVLNGLTTSMHDFNFSQDQAVLVASKMNTAVGLSKTTLQDFGGSLHSVEPVVAGLSQGLDTLGKQHLMSDVYGSLAQITQSGTSADQATQNMAHTFTSLAKPTQQMRDMMGALGLDSQDLADHLGERGLAQTLQIVQQAIAQHTQNGQVNLDVMYRNSQVARAEAEAFNALPGPVKAVAQAIKDNTLSYAEFRKTRGGLSVEQANDLNQWMALENRVTGFNNVVKSGIGTQLDSNQALALAVGGQDNLRVALQLTGENQDAVNDKIKQIDQTTEGANHTVKGFNETTDTLNFKMQAAKDAFGAAAIEIGSAFVPFMTSAANVAKDVGDTMAKHPAIMHAVIDAVGALGGAWLIFKGMNIAETILSPIARGLGNIVIGEEAAETGAARLSGALSGLGKAGAAGPAAQLGGQALQDATAGNDFWHGAAVVGTDAGTGAAVGAGIGSVIPVIGTGVGAGVGAVIGGGIGLYNQITGRAGGGPLGAPGPKGRDSALFWGADGEHVLTHDEVQKMGGHAGVYRFRSDLMNNRVVLSRAYGGAVGPDVQAAESMVGTPYSQAARYDCSGMVGRVVEAATGIGGGLPTTKNMGEWLAARGFVPGIGGPGTISVGWYDHGGGPNC